MSRDEYRKEFRENLLRGHERKITRIRSRTTDEETFTLLCELTERLKLWPPFTNWRTYPSKAVYNVKYDILCELTVDWVLDVYANEVMSTLDCISDDDGDCKAYLDALKAVKKFLLTWHGKLMEDCDKADRVDLDILREAKEEAKKLCWKCFNCNEIIRVRVMRSKSCST